MREAEMEKIQITRLFLAFCARQIWGLLTDEEREAVVTAERYALGLVDSKRLDLDLARATDAVIHSHDGWFWLSRSPAIAAASGNPCEVASLCAREASLAATKEFINSISKAIPAQRRDEMKATLCRMFSGFRNAVAAAQNNYWSFLLEVLHD